MQTKTRRLCIISGMMLIVLVLLIVYNLLDNKGQKYDLCEVNLPIFPDANVQSIRQGFDKSIGCKYVSYKVTVKFPAMEVIEFYNKKFEDMNLKKYSEDNYGNKGWENFSPRSGEWEPTLDVPARFIGSWIDEQKSQRVLLDLFYRYDWQDPKWKEDLLVECKVCPFFDFRNLSKEKFEKEGIKRR